MIKESTIRKIKEYCREHNVNVINLRSVKQSGKTRTVVTCRCNQCDERFDIKWDSLRQQKYKGLCTRCAHKASSAHRVLSVQEVVSRFEKEGYKVITPIDKIKPRGKRHVYFTPVEIMNKYGDVYKTNCNNFCSCIDYYRELSNCDKRNEILKNESRLEYKVRKFLQENDIPHKQQFRFMDCRGKKYPLPFDFCLYYKDDNRMLIEVHGEQHYRETSVFHKWHESFKELQKHDRTKLYYCQKNNIPLLILPYDKIDNKEELYKNMILNFINNNQ